MTKKLTIAIADDVYEGLHRVAGKRQIGRYIESLARPHVVPAALEAAYREAARDEQAEAEALAWIESDLSETLSDDSTESR